MILLSTIKHQKKIAYSLLIIFYLDLITPGIVSAASRRNSDQTEAQTRFNNKTIFSGFGQSKNNLELTAGNGSTIIDLKNSGSNLFETLADENVTGSDKADIGGPDQPEMKSFQSVNAGNMVDLFTGDFSYSVPLLDVGGYPVNLHYSSGITMDQEASWVGLGWNVNPGSISRSMRGLPDDFDPKNDSLKRTQHIKENKTTGVTLEPSLEIIGTPLNVSARFGIFHNSYNGYGLETGAGIGGTARAAFGSLTGNLSISNNSQEGIRISPSLSAGFGKSDAASNLRGSLGISTGYSSRAGISSIQINGGVQSDRFGYITALSSYLSPHANISFSTPSYSPNISMPITNKAYSFTGKIGGELWGVDAGASFTGYTNEQSIAPEDVVQVIPAAGYLYSTNSNNQQNVLLDYNREKDMEYNFKTTPTIALPQYTYDAFSISGEGIGGSFRPYRGDVGYVFDHSISTRSSSTNGSIDVGFGAAAHVGLEITNVTTSNANHRWNKSNLMEPKLRFQSADTTYEPVYFRNPGEKTTNALSYYRAIGDDSLIRIKLSGSKDNVKAESAFIKYDNEGKPHLELPVTEKLVKKQRDKRTQAISYFTAEDAAILGLDKTIKSYKENTIPVAGCQDTIREMPRVDKIRKKNHLSEISVLNSDGRKYVYGLPIYNVEQKDVTFSVTKETDQQNIDKGLVQYWAGDNTTGNTKGKDGYFSKDEMPAYAHNFLLTGIVSPDYIDITGDGISEDDPGDAVKFNYSQVYGEENGYYQWRTPFQSNRANYNEGLKTYNRDDKGTYLYGKKEIWYLNSIESKTMIAVFRVANDRKDAYSVQDENGGPNTARSTRRLERIDLYVKADLIKNGTNKARPVKSVHFSQSYSLCKGAAVDANIGKLTLDSVWFTYNKNNKGKLNPYVFRYHPEQDGTPKAAFNPGFNSKQSDRWGTYKDPAYNPGGLNNADYPYSEQNSTRAANNAAVWNLTDIQLPSGGRMHITYESDDYGYVQNKRATQMVMIAGINQPTHNKLYNPSSDKKEDYYTIYVNTPDPLKNKEDLRSKYLAIDDVLYFKMAVKMPSDEFGAGEEMVPGYGTVEDFGITEGNNKQFWIRLAPVDRRSPMSRAALQFLRLNLKSKAYPGSEGLDKLNLANLVKMMATSFKELANMIKGFDDAAKSTGICSEVDLSTSFIRLSNPNYKKYGGGYRVKKVEVYDNWKKMTNQKESVYGQEYTYTTVEDVNGQKKIISSGVATYEPAIGAEENPFRRPIAYVEKTAPLGPVNYMFSEEPIGETFFASPMVGYSKVRVRTINAKARSANGWEESEFYTSKDFPTLVEHTLLEPGSSKFKYETNSNFLRLNHKNYVTLSQGFKIELNDMNGKMKAQSTYAETDPVNPIKYSLNFYKTDDDKASQKHLNNKVWVVDSTNGNINTAGEIGKDIEIMVDLREQRSQAFTKGFSPNYDMIAPFIPPVIPVLYLPSKVNLPQKEDTRFRSAAVVKIVQRYGILDSVVVMDKGSMVSTKNLLYDAETGNVLLSRTNNEFNDPIYNFNYPAYWAYSGMGMAYKNLSAVFQSNPTTGTFQINGGKLYKAGNPEAYPAELFFESGDEIYVYSAQKAIPGTDCRYLVSQEGGWSGKLWVIEAAKGLEKDNGLYFIDSLGKVAPDMIIQKMVIARSGKRNMPDVSAGNVTMLSNPLKEITGSKYKIVIDNNSKVVNASTATFKDLWKVENSEYQQDSCYSLYKQVYGEVFYPSAQSVIFRDIHIRKNHTPPFPGNIFSNHFVASSYKRNLGNRNNHIRYNLKSVIQFDLASRIRPDAIITNAVLNLQANAPTQAWSGVNDSRLQNFPQKTKAHYLYGDLNNTTNASNIREVTGGWNINNTTFKTLLTGSNQASISSAPDESCLDRSVNVTAFAAKMVSSPGTNYGLVLNLNDLTTGPSEDGSSERTLSFCTKMPVATKGYEMFALPNGCVNCDTSTTLSVDYSYYKDTCVKVCRKNISDTATNPYRWGILGNWRMERAYSYYNARQEDNAITKNSDIRQEGTLKDFSPYWTFGAAGIVATEDTTRWVWNSAIANFNRKGFEIENYDPLNRYNSGLYGYNQTLPVAVAQNSKYRELLFDGFEDYGYKTTYCATCPPRREFDFLKGQSGVDTTTTQSHTGLYSLKVNNGYESLLTVLIDSVNNPGPAISAKIDSTAITTKTVVGSGTGLTGSYTMGTKITYPYFNYSYCYAVGSSQTRIDTAIQFDWRNNTPIALEPGRCNETYEVKWRGTIQPRVSGPYYFYLDGYGSATLLVNDAIIFSSSSYNHWPVRSVYLNAGELYSIVLSYTKRVSDPPPGFLTLSWYSPAGQRYEPVPKRFLYPAFPVATQDTVGSVVSIINYYCVKANTVKPLNVIRPVFSPLTKTKLNVSAWVRLDVVDCNATPALDSVIQVHFNTGGVASTRWLKKTGLRIEGWQRYEANVDVPATASLMYLRLKTLSGHNIFVDDIRVQPFNSGMKGFVYNPVNLRLMAELDENNYASFYEYDDDGTLIRVKKETERGIMTIKETRSALLKE